MIVTHQPKLVSHLFFGRSAGFVLLSYGFGPSSVGNRIDNFISLLLSSTIAQG